MCICTCICVCVCYYFNPGYLFIYLFIFNRFEATLFRFLIVKFVVVVWDFWDRVPLVLAILDHECYIYQVGLKFTEILLSLLPKCWDLRRVPPHPANFKLKKIFYVYECFAWMYVCLPHAFLVPMEDIGGHQFPWNCNYWQLWATVCSGKQNWAVFETDKHSLPPSHLSSSTW